MPAHRGPPAAQTPASPTAKATAKYTNKDGSKFITVPKVAAAADSSQPSTPAPAARPLPPTIPAKDAVEPAPPVNRKKQKRREKAAARAAAGQGPATPNGRANDSASPDLNVGSPRSDVAEPRDSDEDELFVPPQAMASTANGIDPSGPKSKKSKKKKKKATVTDDSATANAATSQAPLPPFRSGMSKEKIWNTNTHEERERIKEFWLGLGEDERKSLVKVEKNAVLKKMKEQQKHTCSCTVCGRKRTAIEEELEGLYDAYYLELEQFAHQGEGAAVLSGARDYHHRPSRALSLSYAGQQPSRGRIVEQLADEEDEEEYEDEYSDASYGEYSDDDPEDDEHGHVADFLAFGNSLQVKGTDFVVEDFDRGAERVAGGILTVADDILQNDGRRFIEMMENLAERRLKREESTPGHHPLNGDLASHPPPPPEEDDYEEEEEEEEDYDDSQDESYDDEQVCSPVHDAKTPVLSRFLTRCKGEHDGRPTDGGRPTDVPNIRSPHV